MKIIEWVRSIIKKTHVCIYSKPVASKYVGFGTRDCVYKCRCGKGTIKTIRRDFNQQFPIETNMFITKKEFEAIRDNIMIKWKI